MTEAMPFLQKFDITFLRPPTIRTGPFLCAVGAGFHARPASVNGQRRTPV